jgi:ubiquinone/menaquinone biosynthesis C-methylase UbiE
VYGWFTQNQIWYESCARLTNYFPEAQPKRTLRVLELGCGPGVTAIEIKKRRGDALVIGLDLAPRMLHEAQGYIRQAHFDSAQIPLVLADAEALPFADGSLDVVTGHSFLYLVPNREQVLREAKRVLRAGGIYVSMEPQAGAKSSGVYRRMWRDVRYAISVIPWRFYSEAHGQLSDSRFRELFDQVGLRPKESEVVLEGLGIIGRAEKT